MAEQPSQRVSPSRWRRHAGRLALLGVSVAAALAVGELMARWQMPPRPVLRFQQLGKVLAGQPRQQFMELIEDDPELFWRLAPGIHLPDGDRPFSGLVSNAAGLREAHEIPSQKPPGQVRILFLGDSCTFGYLLPHTQTFVEQTELLLKQAYPALDIECINAGVPGYSLFQGTRFLKTRGRSYQPDLVVLNFGWNDGAEWDGYSDQQVYLELQARQPPRALRWSRLAQLIVAAGRAPSADATDRPARPRLTPQEFTELLQDVRATARDIGCDVLLYVAGGRPNLTSDPLRLRLDEYQEAQIAFGQSLHLTGNGPPACLNGVETIARLAMTWPLETILFDEVHTTALANQAVARELVRHLTPWLDERARR